MLTCNTSTDLHQWNILDPNTGMTHTRLIAAPTMAGAAMITPLQVQSYTINFAVLSQPNTVPLISTLTIDDVTDYLNAFRIGCLEIDSGNNGMISINIIGANTLEGKH